MLGKKKIVALCTARLNDSSNHEFVSELNKRLVARGYRMIIYHMCSDFYWLDNFINTDDAIYNLMDYSIIDAVIVMDEKIKNAELTEYLVNTAKAHGKPVITIDGDRQYEGCINVTFDYATGFEKIVRHVVEEHHAKNIHFIAGYRNNYFSDQRIDIFKKVLAENNIEYSDDMLSYGEFWANPTQEIVRERLQNGLVPEAIICANDIMAINAVAIVQECGYRVPEDVIVTGFDGIDEIYFTDPQITTGVCDYSNMADATLNVLVDAMDNVKMKEEVLIVPDFFMAESCGCAKCRNRNQTNYMSRINNRFYRYQDDSKLLAYWSERMMSVNDVNAMSEKLDDETLKNVICVINKSCVNESISPEKLAEMADFEDEMIVIKHLDVKDFKPYSIKPMDIYNKLYPYIEGEIPVVFNAVCSINRLLGFACFCFDTTDITTYSRISQLISSLSHGLSGYISMQYQRYLSQKILDTYAHDSLTGLYNRMGFDDVFEKRIAIAKDNSEMITAILADLDGLKYINDNYGHLVGDKAIKAVADSLKAACMEDSLLVRIGGDEFLAIVFGECDFETIEKNFDEEISRFNETSNLPCKAAASIGYYQTLNVNTANLDLLIKHADEAMYMEKKKHHQI